MNWLETVLVIIAISLDIFAAIACKGAQLSKIEKKPMMILCALFAVWQAVALGLGSLAGSYLYRRDIHQTSNSTEAVAAVLFVVLAVMMLRKAYQKENFTEHRDDEFAWKSLVCRLAIISIGTMILGVALGFLGTPTTIVLVVVLLVTVCVVIAGLYVGYHFGYAIRPKVYAAAGILLVIAAVDTAIRHIFFF